MTLELPDPKAPIHPDRWDHEPCHQCNKNTFPSRGDREDDHNECTKKCGTEECTSPCPCECNEPLTRNELMKLRRMLEALS